MILRNRFGGAGLLYGFSATLIVLTLSVGPLYLAPDEGISTPMLQLLYMAFVVDLMTMPFQMGSRLTGRNMLRFSAVIVSFLLHIGVMAWLTKVVNDGGSRIPWHQVAMLVWLSILPFCHAIRPGVMQPTHPDHPDFKPPPDMQIGDPLTFSFKNVWRPEYQAKSMRSEEAIGFLFMGLVLQGVGAIFFYDSFMLSFAGSSVAPVDPAKVCFSCILVMGGLRALVQVAKC